MKDISISFFISGEEQEILPGNPLWDLALSGINSAKTNRDVSKITVGDYFRAAHFFLSQNYFSALVKGLNAFFKYPVHKSHIKQVNVFLEKHGAFYHPMKVKVELNNADKCYFVLNGAVSTEGLSLIESEYQLISRLNKAFSKQYLPQVYAMAFVEALNIRAAFFLGQWFKGYKEFHITNHSDKSEKSEKSEKKQIALWESNDTCQYISEEKALAIYKEIAKILTYYYNIETFEQISLWHHAAGDFIAKKEKTGFGKTGFKVKLITARAYQPLNEFSSDEKHGKDHILPSLLIFFIKLSLKIRLDRLDGQGKYTLLSDKVTEAAVNGFLDALDEKTDNFDFGPDYISDFGYKYGNLKNIFTGFFKQFDAEQLMVIVKNIAESEEFNDTENTLIKENSETHCRILHKIFNKL